MIRITDEMVESAAAGAWTVAVSGEFSWATLDATSKDAWRREARGALDAALPHLEGATPEWTDEERGFVETALAAADAGNAGHWPTVATYLAAEVRRLRALEGATPAVDREAVRGKLDQLWGWAKSGERRDLEGGEYYLMAKENVDRFTVSVLALIGGAS